MSGVAGFLGTATGPARLRAELRRRTRPLAELLAASRSPRALGAGIPRSALGGDLLDLLGRRFELAMLGGEETAAGPTDRPPSGGRGGWIGGGPRRGRPPAAAMAAAAPGVAAAAGGAPSPGRRRGALPPPGAPSSSPPTPALPEPSPASPDVRSRSAATVPGRAPGVQPQTPEPPLAAAATRRPAPLSALERALGEYRRLSDAERTAAAGSVGPASPPVALPAPRSRPSPAGPTLAAGTRSPGSWPQRTGRQVAEKARRLPLSGVAPPPSETSAVTAGDGVEIKNVFHIEVAGGERDEGADDLADRIADVLRLQAQQHGIDIT